MRIHTTSVPATKYLPERIHVKFTDDNNVPNNATDRTFDLLNELDSDHDLAAYKFLQFNGMADRECVRIGATLTKRGYIYQIVED